MPIMTGRKGAGRAGTGRAFLWCSLFCIYSLILLVANMNAMTEIALQHPEEHRLHVTLLT